jgi:RNA polymerase sigma-70 factor (ECF subfamily)
MANETQPRWDRRMQQRLARGEAAALGELYDRFAPLVHSLAHRVLDDETAADRVTREVFASIWEEPHAYDPQRGPMRSWIAGLTQETATARLRRRHGAAVPGGVGTAGADVADDAETERRREQIEEKVRAASTAARADYIVTSMPSSLRAALEITYFQRRDYRDAARELGVTEDEARRRLRLGLQLLSSARSHPLPGQASGTGRRL